MSTMSTPEPDVSFWEFVSCERCQLPFTIPSGATVPFWVTECGHVVCNNHLNADQSCGICRAPGIQVVPLQREMDPPMSEWFQPVHIGLDSVAQAAKFQFEKMALQLRHFRARCQQQRAFIERLKYEVEELKKRNEQLLGENDHFQRQNSEQGQYQSGPNLNGKRLRTGVSPHDRVSVTSSPRSVATPSGPSRLTLPHNQIAPSLTSNNRKHDSSGDDSQPGLSVNQPGSSFKDKYAYVPPATPQFFRPQLTHTQNVPKTFRRSRYNEIQEPLQVQQTFTAKNEGHQSMPPPPAPPQPSAKFKVGRPPQSAQAEGYQTDRLSNYQHRQDLTFGNQRIPQPPGPSRPGTTRLPQSGQLHSEHVHQAFTVNSSHNPQEPPSFPSIQRFSSSAGHQVSAAPATSNAPQRFIPAGTRVPSRAQKTNSTPQRSPFPGEQGT